jgi:hypothetical protein
VVLQNTFRYPQTQACSRLPFGGKERTEEKIQSLKLVSALSLLSTAKSLTDALLGAGWRGVPLQAWPVLVGA